MENGTGQNSGISGSDCNDISSRSSCERHSACEWINNVNVFNFRKKIVFLMISFLYIFFRKVNTSVKKNFLVLRNMPNIIMAAFRTTFVMKFIHKAIVKQTPIVFGIIM